MSGIAGVVHWDGSSVEPASLERIVSFLRFRGPDAERFWHDGPAGFAHTLLRTTREAEHECQPLTVNELTITADARVDGREELTAALAARGSTVFPDASDAELILHAWRVWGEACVDHLLGDFAFAIWDARAQRLFCARDHFGIKPFYYARPAGGFLFSNTLEVLKHGPAVSNRLNHRAVADFLVEGYNRDLATTLFADIQRLPPAHTLVAGKDEFRLRRYWAPAEGEPLRYRRDGEYVEHFLDLLRCGVRDRLRIPRAVVHMSGGLDSCSVAAVASTLPGHQRAELRACTLFSSARSPDPEQYFGGVAARALQIEIEFLDAHAFRPFQGAGSGLFETPEPLHEPFLALLLAHLTKTSEYARVALTGQGGDPAFSTSVTHYARTLLRGGHLGRFVSDFGRFLMAEGRAKRLYLRKRLQIRRERRQPPPPKPVWLNPDFAELIAPPDQPFGSKPAGVRPTAVWALSAPIWAYHFELCDPGVTRILVECRNPYFDVRLVEFLLRLPPVPWCTDKELVRAAMKGQLPEEIRLRRKTPLDVDPLLVHLREMAERPWEAIQPDPAIERYVSWSRIPPTVNGMDSASVWLHLAPVSLNLWLRSRDPHL